MLSGRAVTHNKASLDNIVSCLEGKSTCPKRPIVLSNYGYLQKFLEGSVPSGEVIWMDSAVHDIKLAGYEIISVHDYKTLVLVSRLIPDLV